MPRWLVVQEIEEGSRRRFSIHDWRACFVVLLVVCVAETAILGQPEFEFSVGPPLDEDAVDDGVAISAAVFITP